MKESPKLSILPPQKNTDDHDPPVFFPNHKKNGHGGMPGPRDRRSRWSWGFPTNPTNLNDPKRLFANKQPKKVTPSCREGAAVFSDLVATEKLHHSCFCCGVPVLYVFFCAPIFFPNFCVGSICRDSDV